MAEFDAKKFEEWKAPADNTLAGLVLANGGTITVLVRRTGWGDGSIFDTETGYRSPDGKFWLASGNFDVREYNPATEEEAVALIKSRANTCVGD